MPPSDAVREVMAEILESMGYRVLQSNDGLEAMELFTAHQQDIALAAWRWPNKSGQ